MDPLGTYQNNRKEIDFLRNLTFEQKVVLAKAISQRLGGLPTVGPLDASPRPTPPHMGKSLLEYLKGNVMGRPPEGKWIDPKHQRVSGQQEERIYSEPNYNWEIGEVGPVGYAGLGKASQRAAESALRSNVFKINKTDDVKRGFDKIINEFSEEFDPDNLVNEFLNISNDRQILRESIEEVFGNSPPKEAKGLYDEAFEAWAEDKVDVLRDRMLDKMNNYRSGLRKIKRNL